MTTREEPKGIGFFNIKSGDTHHAKIEPTIAAYINSSDMGINASRGQDYGWRLEPDWVKRVKAFRRDTMQMQILSARSNGQKPTTVQILYYLYGEELRAYNEDLEEHENPFEEQYQKDIANKPSKSETSAPALDEIPEEVDEADLIPAEDDIDAMAEEATSDKPKSKANPKK